MYALHLRKSRTDIEMESYGVDTLAKHEERLRELAFKLKIDISEEHIYREVESGESLEYRPTMQKLLKNIQEKKYKGVLTIDLDRLARGNTKEQGIISEAFKLTNTQIITPNKIYNPNDISDEDFIDFGLFMARVEYKAITRRMKSGKLQTVKNGNFILPYAPFGYDILKVRRGERTLVKNENADYVKKIFDWHINDRLSIGEITRKMTTLKIKTTRGNTNWNKSTVISILQNVTYTGKIKWNTRKKETVFENGVAIKKRIKQDDYLLIDGKHEPIIDEETFNKAQSLFNFNSRKNVDLSLKNILAGLLKCSKCGKCLNRDSSKLKQPRYKHKSGYHCNCKSAICSEVDEAIFNQIESDIKHFEIVLESEKPKDNSKIIAQLQKQLKELEGQQDELYTLLEKKIYTEKIFVQRHTKLENEIEAIKTELKIEKSKQVKPKDESEKIITLKTVMEKLKDKSVDVKAKNDLLKSIIQKIEYTHDNEITLEIFYL